MTALAHGLELVAFAIQISLLCQGHDVAVVVLGPLDRILVLIDLDHVVRLSELRILPSLRLECLP